jgi:hypothetical protein
MSKKKTPNTEEVEFDYRLLRPESLIFLGRNIEVQFLGESPWGTDYYGDFDAKAQRIRVLENLTPVEEMDTLVHEILHLIMFYMRIMMGNVDEEQIVHRLATGFSSVLVENPQVAQYLAAMSHVSLKEIDPTYD